MLIPGCTYGKSYIVVLNAHHCYPGLLIRIIKQLDPDPHGEEQLDPDIQKINADPHSPAATIYHNVPKQIFGFQENRVEIWCGQSQGAMAIFSLTDSVVTSQDIAHHTLGRPRHHHIPLPPPPHAPCPRHCLLSILHISKLSA